MQATSIKIGARLTGAAGGIGPGAVSKMRPLFGVMVNTKPGKQAPLFGTTVSM